MTQPDRLRALIPLNALREENFRSLLRQVRVEPYAPEATVFSAGDTDADSIYLIEGEIALLRPNGFKRSLTATSPDALYPLVHLKPRQFSGIAKTAISVARIDSALLDRMLTVDQSCAYEVDEIGAEDSDWAFHMMQHPGFQKVPSGNMVALFQRFDEMPVEARQVIIRQGDPGDYYYLIKSGRFAVTRKMADGRVQPVAELTAGQAFGEEALISKLPRNATVIALEAGTLMRLSAEDFEALLAEPLVRWIDLDYAQEMVKAGAGLLDVRTTGEFARGAIKGAINMPLSLLRRCATELDRKRPWIIYCQTGNRSAAAAFLLAQLGFEVAGLAGGLDALGSAQAAQTTEAGEDA
jgi:CRP-like cAMP-binding protein